MSSYSTTLRRRQPWFTSISGTTNPNSGPGCDTQPSQRDSRYHSPIDDLHNSHTLIYTPKTKPLYATRSRYQHSLNRGRFCCIQGRMGGVRHIIRNLFCMHAHTHALLSVFVLVYYVWGHTDIRQHDGVGHSTTSRLIGIKGRWRYSVPTVYHVYINNFVRII